MESIPGAALWGKKQSGHYSKASEKKKKYTPLKRYAITKNLILILTNCDREIIVVGSEYPGGCGRLS